MAIAMLAKMVLYTFGVQNMKSGSATLECLGSEQQVSI